MRKLAVVLVIALCLMLLPATAALAAAGPASCVGHESSSISPKGSSDEVPGGRPELNGFFKSLGGPQGQTVKLFAQTHAGSHEDCDEAFE